MGEDYGILLFKGRKDKIVSKNYQVSCKMCNKRKSDEYVSKKEDYYERFKI